MDIGWIFPQPEPVRVGARTLLAAPLRLKDLARLQGFLRRARPCPLESARAAIDAAPVGSEARRRLLRDAYRGCKSWPARLGTEEARALLDTDEGLAFWLEVVLGPENPGLAGADFAALADSITVGQYGRLARVAYGSAPLDELSRMITPDSFPDDPAAGPTNWGLVVSGLVRETGWTVEEVGELRLTTLAAIRSEGSAGSGAVEPPPGMGRFAFARRQRRFFGPDRDEEETTPEGEGA